MKRFFRALILAGFLWDRPDVIQHTLNSIVSITSTTVDDDGNEQPTYCTGFVVAKGQALTAAHCVETDYPLFAGEKETTILKQNEQFALVSVSPDVPALQFADKLRVQDPVTAFGFAWAHMNIFSRHVSAFRGLDFSIDGPLAPGMSGGPTVDRQGRVVGINQMSNSVIGILCGAQEIRRFLDTP